MRTHLWNKSILLSLALLSGCGVSSFEALQPGSFEQMPSAANSEMTVTQNNVADGITPAEIKVVIRSQDNIPLVNHTVLLGSSGTENVMVPCTPTDSSGSSTCFLYSTKSESKTVTVSGGLTLSKDTMFLPPRPSRSIFGVVAAAGDLTLPTGHRAIAAAGITEAHIVKSDLNGIIRAYTSSHGVVIGE